MQRGRSRSSLQASEAGFFTSYSRNGRFVSYYGDNHPLYAGNVVKAMASARDGYPKVVELFADQLASLNPKNQAEREAQWKRLKERLDSELVARVSEVRRLTPTIIEVVVHAPSAARKFEPGQFYRLQNYESFAEQREDTRLLMEGIALTGAWVDREKGLLSLIALELGVSSRLCAPVETWRTCCRYGTHRCAKRNRTLGKCSADAAAALATPCCSPLRRKCATRATA